MYKLTKNRNFKYVNTKFNKQLYVTPLVTDTHLHMLGLGEKLSQPTLEGKNLFDIKKILEELLKQNYDKIILRGWMEEFSKPTKSFLDEITKDIPTLLIRRCGHIAVVNSKVFEIIDFTGLKSYINFEKGIIKEKAIDKFYEIFGAFNNIKNNYEIAKKFLKSKGYGFVHSDDLHGLSKEDLPYKEDKDFDVYEKVAIKNFEELLKYYEEGYFDEFNSVKVYLDGSLGGRTAYLLKKYNDADTFGEKLWSDEELTEVVKFCEGKSLHLAAHAIGDGAVNQILNIFKRLKPKLIHRIIHAEILNEVQIKDLKSFNIIVDVQPQFIESDKVFINERLGERIENAFRFYDLFKNNIPLFFSSDAPVEEPDWIKDIVTLKYIGIPYEYSLHQIIYAPELVDKIDRELSMEDKALIFKENPFVKVSKPEIFGEEEKGVTF